MSAPQPEPGAEPHPDGPEYYAPEEDPERRKSPRRGMCAAVLALQAIVLGLTTPVMIAVEDVSTWTGVGIGLGLCLVCFLLSGMLRRSRAYAAGYVVQAASIALGFVVSMMFVVGIIFAILWTTADLLGRKIERERAAAFAAFDRLQAEGDG